jgi:putative transcriptional regulator
MKDIDIYELSDKRIAEEWGTHIKGLRLRKNRTQQDLAKTTCLSLNVIKSLESGHAKLSTLIAVLRELKALDSLKHMISQPTISPLQIAKMQGKRRQRASGTHIKQPPSTPKDISEW